MANTGLGPLPFVVYSGDIYRPTYVGNEYATQTILPATGTGSLTLLTGAPGYVLTNIGFQVDPPSTLATAATISVILSDSSYGTVANYRYYLPASFIGQNFPVNDRVVNGAGFYFHNKVANSVLTVRTDTALATGAIRFFVRYALTQQLAI